MTSPIFSNEEVNLLQALRSRSTECKENFRQKYINTNLLCSLCQTENENQQHILTCTVLIEKFRSENLSIDQVEYENLFSNNVNKQKEVTQLFMELFKIRETLLEDNSQQDPSPTDVELSMNNNLLDCTVYSSMTCLGQNTKQYNTRFLDKQIMVTHFNGSRLTTVQKYQ